MPPSRPIDFPSSARRHIQDALLLEERGRLPNAGHLYGLAAECGLKAILIWHGHPTDAEGSPQRPFREHVDKLLISHNMTAITTFLTGRSGAHYLSLIPSISNFSDWSASHRYFSESSLPASLHKWRQGAVEIGQMLDYALTEGRK